MIQRADDMILYVENPNDSTKKKLKLKNKFSKVADVKYISRNSLLFYTPIMKYV